MILDYSRHDGQYYRGIFEPFEEISKCRFEIVRNNGTIERTNLLLDLDTAKEIYLLTYKKDGFLRSCQKIDKKSLLI